MTLEGVLPGANLKSGSDITIPQRSCGMCSKTIKLRESADTVLCTLILEVVDAGFEGVCEHYVESSKNPDQTCC